MPPRSMLVILYAVKFKNSLVNFEAVTEDLILRRNLNEEARKLDMDHFHDMIRTAQDDEILKVFNDLPFRSEKYHEHYDTPIRYLGYQVTSFRKPLLH